MNDVSNHRQNEKKESWKKNVRIPIILWLAKFNIKSWVCQELYSVITKDLYQQNFVIYRSACEIRLEVPQDLNTTDGKGDAKFLVY